MPDPIIREASINDLPRLLELEQKIIDAERPYDPAIKADNVTYYDLADLLSGPDSHVVVVESNGEVVGSGYAQIRLSKPCFAHDKHCYLGFIYLEPEYRGKAMGGAIIDALRSWGVNRGMRNFQLGVYADNVAAIRAYEKIGFKPVSIMMELVV